MADLEGAMERYEDHVREALNSPDTIRMYLQRTRTFLTEVPRAIDAGPDELRGICDEYVAGLPQNNSISVTAAAVRHWWSTVSGRPWLDRITLDGLEPREEIDRECEAFERWFRGLGHASDETAAVRAKDLRAFLYLSFDGMPFDRCLVDAEMVAAHLSGALSSKAESTRGKFAACARAYARYLESEGLPSLASSLALLGMRGGPAAKPPPAATGDDEYRAMLAAADNGTERGRRDLAMIRLMGDLGLRRSDVARLDLDDVDWHRAVLNVRRSKSKTGRALPIPAALGSALEAYVLHARDNTSASRALFLPMGREAAGDRMTYEQVGGAVSLVAGRAGVKRAGATHGLRRAVGTGMTNNGVPVKVIADVLGHESVTTTMGYLRVSEETLRTACSPWPEGGDLACGRR